MYMSKIVEVYKFFHPEAKDEKRAAGTGGELSTTEKKRLIERAKQAGIKLPRKGL